MTSDFISTTSTVSLTLYTPWVVVCSDVEKIQSGIGEKIGLFLQYVTTFLLGYTVGFVQGWKLTLVLISVVPLLLVVAVILTTVRRACVCLPHC